MTNCYAPSEVRDLYNTMASYYDASNVALRSALTQFTELAHPVFGESILDLGTGPGRLLQLLLWSARSQQPLPVPPPAHPTNQPGSLVVVDIAENFEPVIRLYIQQAEPAVRISICKAGSSNDRASAVKTMIDQDRLDHAGPLSRGEARMYLGMGANFVNPDLVAHLAQKAPGGRGFDLVTANHVLSHVSPVLHVNVLQQWASALAPGGRLVVERALYHQHPEAQLGLTCPGQLVIKSRTDNPAVLAVLGHGQCAPDRFWVVCEQQLRELAAKAGLRVVRVVWACHGDHGAALGGHFASIWDDEWEADLRRRAPGAPDHELVELLCERAKEEAEKYTREAKDTRVAYNLVSVVAELQA